MVSVVLVGERNHEIAFGGQGFVAEPWSDPGFNCIYDLFVERDLVVGKIDVSFGEARLRDEGDCKNQGEDSERHAVEN